ncbi:MAG: efflux RND transporter periplasmic adaptor subunit [Gemmatimonas sp.]
MNANSAGYKASRRSRRALIATAFATGVVAFGACKKADEKPVDTAAAAQPAQQLSTADITRADTSRLAAGTLVTGTLHPADVVVVRAQLAGTLQRVRADRGTSVSRGQTLAVIEAVGVQSQAEGAKASVAAASAVLALAQKKLDGARMLHKAGAISDVDLKVAEADFASAQAQLASATAQSSTAGENAGRATVTAPLTGVISDRRIQDGEAVRVGDELFTIVNPRELELKADIPVDEAGAVKVGQSVRFTLAAMPGQVFTGRVDRKDPVASEDTRQVGLYLRVPNANGKIVAGQFASGRIVSGDAKAVVVVPVGAVREGSGKFWVLRIDNGKIERRDVTVGSRDEAAGLVVVTSGLAAGDQVITSPGLQIAAGTRITIASDSAR